MMKGNNKPTTLEQFLFSCQSKTVQQAFIRPALLNQLFEKKIKILSGKKRHINFPYFLARVKRSNKLFIYLKNDLLFLIKYLIILWLN
ncbi:hypothetical protein AKL22_07985 [Carnobacterium maltaromaticum]|nr:hypothetical protein [Carnobacterium maltaromaticum]